MDTENPGGHYLSGVQISTLEFTEEKEMIVVLAKQDVIKCEKCGHTFITRMSTDYKHSDKSDIEWRFSLLCNVNHVIGCGDSYAKRG